ncbi:unnamed protein product [Linum tenue]|uniref:PB1 domain-containing protein n=1 Tax=Linum tenue TaxID=586396 RepID=A0AAV0MX24_9ROSI|nr:unnamed protein product [Linum tenue]
MVSESRKNGAAAETVKFLCSYGGKIAPRYGDGKLRYVGGLTRVLAVHRSVSSAELMVKLGEFCGQSVELRCQLPGGDLETLVLIKSDEELASLVEEYDRCCPGAKIRAVLSPPKSLKTVSPPPSSPPSSGDSSPLAPDYYYYRQSRCGCHTPPIGFRTGGVRGNYSPRFAIGQRRIIPAAAGFGIRTRT